MIPGHLLPDSVEYNGRIYAVNYDAMNVLNAFSVFRDPLLSDFLQVETALDLLVTDRHETDPYLLRAVIEQVQKPKKTDGPQYMDLWQDWDYIYAAFRQAYSIDLNRDKLHYLEFLALLEAVPQSTKLSEIIGIRAREIPPANKNNAKEIQQLLKLKAIYALKQDPQDMRDIWGHLFETLKQRAKKV